MSTVHIKKKSAKSVFAEYLCEKGYKKTPERFAVLEEICNTAGHFDIESLYVSMKNRNYKVTRATLYNTLKLLLDCRLVVKHQFGKSTAQFEKNFDLTQHDHLIDIKSGEILEFSDPRLRKIIKEACDRFNFSLSHHSLYLYGERDENS